VTELPPPGSPEQVSKVEEVALAVAASCLANLVDLIVMVFATVQK